MQCIVKKLKTEKWNAEICPHSVYNIHGDWDSGIWYNGIWNNGSWFGGIWLSGFWNYGGWHLDKRNKTTNWINGVWHTGYYFSGPASWDNCKMSPKSYCKPKKTISLNYARYH